MSKENEVAPGVTMETGSEPRDQKDSMEAVKGKGKAPAADDSMMDDDDESSDEEAVSSVM